MCTCRGNHMYVQTHRKKISLLRMEPPTPTTHTHTHTLQELLSPPTPPPVQIPRVYTCVLMRGGWWCGEKWQRANTEPTKYLCLHSTQGQTLQASCCKKLPQMQRAAGRKTAQSSECSSSSSSPPRQEKNKDGGCIPMINSVLIQS